jgi:hypothetical protein
LGPLGQLRARLCASGYWRSTLLRYLEEAMAESYRQLRAYGFGNIVKGVSFPISGGYVTLSQLGAEGMAIGKGEGLRVGDVADVWQAASAIAAKALRMNESVHQRLLVRPVQQESACQRETKSSASRSQSHCNSALPNKVASWRRSASERSERRGDRR